MLGMRKTYTNNRCHACQKVLDQPKTGRTRFFCDDACKQRRYRFLKRQEEGRVKRHRKPTRKQSLYERAFAIDHKPSPVHRLSEWSAVYRCPVCSQTFQSTRIKRGRVQEYCSDACGRVAREMWREIEDAAARASMTGRADWRVIDRLEEGYLSPLCAHCGVPFPYRVGRGRKRKYCTERCRKDAYEKRYEKAHQGRSRKHRYAPCPYCGERVDRKRTDGKLQRFYCDQTCKDAYSSRRRWRLKRGKADGYRHMRRAAAPRRKQMSSSTGLGTFQQPNRRGSLRWDWDATQDAKPISGIPKRREFRNVSEGKSSGKRAEASYWIREIQEETERLREHGLRKLLESQSSGGSKLYSDNGIDSSGED